jgi:hypothetical protein
VDGKFCQSVEESMLLLGVACLEDGDVAAIRWYWGSKSKENEKAL